MGKMLQQLPILTDAQKDQLKGCIPIPPANESRNSKLDQCLEILATVWLSVSPTESSTRMAREAAEKINEHRQNLHTFWIQAAQLILLNLLLPLLTALFGYIFGTQQANRTS